MGALLGMFAIAGALILAVVAARSLAPEPMKETVSLVVTSLAVCVAAFVWWIGLERNADALERNRERLIDVLAKTPDA